MTKAPLLIALCFCLAIGCKKKDEPANILCTGNGTEAFWPLALGNSWHYTSGETDSIVAHWDSLYVIKITTPNNSELDTLRVTANGDIYLKSPGYAENLFLPADLPLGKKWTGSYPAQNMSDTLTVVSVNTVITTADCLYTGCVKVEVKWQYSASTATDYRYYKKGIGGVMFQVHSGSNTVETGLNGIKLN
jgi:hypothetical protein